MSKQWKCKDCVKQGTDACYFQEVEDGYKYCHDIVVDTDFAYQQGRADELDKIYKMMLLGCGELECEECAYKQYSQDVCQQAFTIGMIEKYIEEQLKEHKQ